MSYSIKHLLLLTAAVACALWAWRCGPSLVAQIAAAADPPALVRDLAGYVIGGSAAVLCALCFVHR